MRMLRILLMTLIGIIATQSCARHPYVVFSHKHYESAPELKRMIRDINVYTKGKLGDPRIRIGYTDGYRVKNDDGIFETVIGSCHSVWGIYPEIDINRKTYKKMTYTKKFLLVAHELGHCECKWFSHNNDLYKDGCPKHYMHESSAPNWCLEKYTQKYLAQVKQGCD